MFPVRLMEASPESVAVIDCPPSVLSVTLNVFTPLSEGANAAVSGKDAEPSELERSTVPVK